MGCGQQILTRRCLTRSEFHIMQNSEYDFPPVQGGIVLADDRPANIVTNGPALNAADLYSGIGGWALGLKMAGINVAASYEISKPACETQANNLGWQREFTRSGQSVLLCLRNIVGWSLSRPARRLRGLARCRLTHRPRLVVLSRECRDR